MTHSGHRAATADHERVRVRRRAIPRSEVPPSPRSRDHATSIAAEPTLGAPGTDNAAPGASEGVSTAPARDPQVGGVVEPSLPRPCHLDRRRAYARRPWDGQRGTGSKRGRVDSAGARSAGRRCRRALAPATMPPRSPQSLRSAPLGRTTRHREQARACRQRRRAIRRSEVSSSPRSRLRPRPRWSRPRALSSAERAHVLGLADRERSPRPSGPTSGAWPTASAILGRAGPRPGPGRPRALSSAERAHVQPTANASAFDPERNGGARAAIGLGAQHAPGDVLLRGGSHPLRHGHAPR